MQGFLPKLLKKTSEIKLFYLFCLVKLFENIISLILITVYCKETYDSFIFWIFLVLSCTIIHLHHNVCYGILGSFYYKITQNFQKGFEGTSIAFMASIGNIGKRTSDYISLSIVEKFDLIVLVGGGWIIGGGMLWIIRNKLLNLEKKLI